MKRILSVVFIAILLLSVTVHAESRSSGNASIAFSDNVATCTGRVVEIGQSIDTTMELWRGGYAGFKLACYRNISY